VTTLDAWVRHGDPPAEDAQHSQFGRGVDLSYTPEPWPAGAGS